MRLLILLMLLSLPAGLLAQTQESAHYPFVDDAGRKLTLPRHPGKVYATSQIGIILLYTLAPERLAGWLFPLQPDEKHFILPQYHKLPVLGGWAGRSSTANVEEIARVHPDIIFSIGLIDAAQRAQAEQLQLQTGIPVVMLELPLTRMDKTYRVVGNMLGETGRSELLAQYCRQRVDEIDKELGQVPESERVRVYYAEGPKGLESDPAGSFHTQVLDFVQGINVAQVSAGMGYGRAEVSIEQVMRWDPQVIIVGYDKQAQDGFFNKAYQLPEWQSITAIRQHRLYQIPALPYDWFDRPPSVNRLIGIQWLAKLLYPARISLDLGRETRYFYELFYHLRLTDQQLDGLIQPAISGVPHG